MIKGKLIFLLIILISAVSTTGFLESGVSEAEETYTKELKELDDYLNKLDSIDGLIDFSTFDGNALSRKLGHDQEKIFDFVRDKIRYQAYRGVLRGGRGTLLEGAGNSIDQSLLLLHLLQETGKSLPYRFVQGTLSSSQANELIAKMINVEKRFEQVADKSYSPENTQKILGLSAKELERQEQEIELEADEFLDSLTKAVGEDYEFVTKKLTERKIKLEVDKSDKIEALVEIAKKHYWLQVKKGEKWVDMDPCFPDSRPGISHCKPEQTLEKLEEKLFHTLSLAVYIEKLAQGKVDNRLVYQNQRHVSDLQGEDVMVGIIPEALDINTLLKSRATKKEVLDKIDSFFQFQPVIDFGRKREFGRPFDLSGNTYIFKNGSFQRASEEGFSALGRRLFKDRGKREDHLSALWFEISLISPGGNRTVFRRELVDRIGIERRSSGNLSISGDWQDPRRVKLALIRSYTILPICSRFKTDFALSKYFEILFSKRDLLRIGLRLRHGQYEGAFSDFSRYADLFPTHLLAFARLGIGFLPEFIPKSANIFYSQPNLYAYEESLDLVQGEQVIHRCGYDVISNRLRAVSSEGDESDISASLLKHGILLSNLEVGMIGSSCGSMEPFSTHVVMEKAKKQKIGFEILMPEEQEILASMDINPVAKSRLRSDLDKGYVIITPEKDVSIEEKKLLAWWRIDPRTSNIIGFTQWGRGQAVAEDMSIVSDISIPLTEKCLKYVACLLQGVTGGGTLYQTNAECLLKFLKDLTNDSIKRVRRQIYIDTAEDMMGLSLGDTVKTLLGAYWKIYDTWLNPK